MKKLTRERSKRGWSLTDASRATGLSEQQLRNLERIGHTRLTLPASVTAYTMIRLLETFDGLDLPDFVAGTTLRVQRGGADVREAEIRSEVLGVSGREQSDR